MRWWLIVFLALLPIVRAANAAEMTFQETYVYDAGESDSKLSCRAVTLLELKKLLLERLGTYIISETKVEKFQLTKDEITSFSAAVVKTEILSEKWDGTTFTLTARIVVDPEEVARQMEKIRQDPAASEEIKKLEVVNAEAMSQMAELKENLSRMQSDFFTINHDFTKSKKILDAWGAFEQGVNLRMVGRYQESLAAFDTAIEANPGHIAYFQRGRTLMKLKKYRQAANDFSRVIEIKPKIHNAYFYRAKCLRKLGDKAVALDDMQQAARLGNDKAWLWLNSHFY